MIAPLLTVRIGGELMKFACIAPRCPNRVVLDVRRLFCAEHTDGLAAYALTHSPLTFAHRFFRFFLAAPRGKA